MPLGFQKLLCDPSLLAWVDLQPGSCRPCQTQLTEHMEQGGHSTSGSSHTSQAGLSTTFVSAGLLHDTVEDTNDVSFEEIGLWFGSAVRRIVEGETRFSKIGKISGMTPGADVKAEDLRQLFLAMTEEVRIIVVKLADRLHNMRTLGSMKPEKQKKIAAETLQVELLLTCNLFNSFSISPTDTQRQILELAAKACTRQRISLLLCFPIQTYFHVCEACRPPALYLRCMHHVCIF